MALRSPALKAVRRAHLEKLPFAAAMSRGCPPPELQRSAGVGVGVGDCRSCVPLAWVIVGDAATEANSSVETSTSVQLCNGTLLRQWAKLAPAIGGQEAGALVSGILNSVWASDRSIATVELEWLEPRVEPPLAPVDRQIADLWGVAVPLIHPVGLMLEPIDLQHSTTAALHVFVSVCC